MNGSYQQAAMERCCDSLKERRKGGLKGAKGEKERERGDLH